VGDRRERSALKRRLPRRHQKLDRTCPIDETALMRIAAMRIPWAAMLIFLAAQLALLAPRAAHAHEAAHQADWPEAVNSDAPHASFTAPCEDGSHHSCACGNLDILARDAGGLAVCLSSSLRALSMPASRAQRSNTDNIYPAACVLAHARPRAPPSLV
jgi:hypothetical protein